MANKLFEIIVGIMALIIVVVTPMNIEPTGYFFIGFVATFLALFFTNNDYYIPDRRIVNTSFAITVVIAILWIMGVVGHYSLLNLIFNVMGCLTIFVVRKAWDTEY